MGVQYLTTGDSGGGSINSATKNSLPIGASKQENKDSFTDAMNIGPSTLAAGVTAMEALRKIGNSKSGAAVRATMATVVLANPSALPQNGASPMPIPTIEKGAGQWRRHASDALAEDRNGRPNKDGDPKNKVTKANYSQGSLKPVVDAGTHKVKRGDKGQIMKHSSKGSARMTGGLSGGSGAGWRGVGASVFSGGAGIGGSGPIMSKLKAH